MERLTPLWTLNHCKQRCNSGLGQFVDDPALLRAAADYLERSRQKVEA